MKTAEKVGAVALLLGLFAWWRWKKAPAAAAAAQAAVTDPEPVKVFGACNEVNVAWCQWALRGMDKWLIGYYQSEPVKLQDVGTPNERYTDLWIAWTQAHIEFNKQYAYLQKIAAAPQGTYSECSGNGLSSFDKAMLAATPTIIKVGNAILKIVIAA